MTDCGLTIIGVFIGKIVVHEKDTQEHTKVKGFRGIPTLNKLVRAANGVNSRSAVVFGMVFEIFKSS